MANPIDLSSAVRFDLPSGTVQLSDNEKGMVVPATVLQSLLKNASLEQRLRVGRDFGGHIGRAMQRRAGSAEKILDGGLELAASHLAAELAVAGLGTCALERWGRALVVQVIGSPIESSDFLTAMVEGALAVATGRAIACTTLSDVGMVRVLVASERGVLRVRGWIEQGVTWSDALVRLHGGGA